MSRVVEQPIVTVQAKVGYNLEEAADALGVSLTFISVWVGGGELPAYTLGREAVILADDLVAFVRTRPRYTDYIGTGSEAAAA